MKLFKSLLVAPATLGLLAPMSVTANEVNLNDISNYSQEEIEINSNSFSNSDAVMPLLAGGEGLVDSHDHESDSFSSTTTASFSADFAIGALDGKDVDASSDDPTGDEGVQAVYGFQIDLTTSFTGEDSLDISIDAGNGASGNALSEFDLNGTSTAGEDGLTVDGVMYTFPLGELTAFVGDNTDASALFTTACTYGGPSNTLDDCGNVNAGVTGGGTAAGASYDFDNGFTVAAGYAGTSAANSGLMTDEGVDVFGVNAAYTTDTYGVSLTYGSVERGTTEDAYTAFNGYWSPEGFPSISMGYELKDIGGAAASVDEATSFFIGLQFDDFGPGTFGFAYGTKEPTVENVSEEYMYEAYYSYDINDGMSITPLVFVKEESTVGDPDETGVMVKTSFSF